MRSGRPESVPTASEAAAGARVCSVSALHGTAGATDGLYGMLGSPGIPGGNERRRRSSGARSSPAMADGGFGCLWGGGYRVRERERGEGKRRQAHGDAAGWLSGLGDAPEPTNLTKMAGGSEVEDDGDGGDAGLPGSWGREGRCRGRGRIRGIAREARERLGGSRRWPRRHRRSPPSCFGARGGRGSCGGTSELLEEAMGGRRQWLRRTAATVCFGRE